MAVTDLPDAEREAFSKAWAAWHPPANEPAYLSTFEAAWCASRDYYTATGPNSYWAKAGLDYKRWLEAAEQRIAELEHGD